MRKNEISFLDTNILVYSVDSLSPFYSKARFLIDKARTRELSFCISPQVVGELYASITNPRKLINSLQPEEGVELVKAFWKTKTILKIFPKQTTMDLSLELVRRYRLKALEFFDAQIVATMLDNGVSVIYTANEEDFARFKEIQVFNPLK
jgi:predicted nucleic acid-binding protein